MVVLAESTASGDEHRRDGWHDAATGGKPIPLALSQPALQRGYTVLYLGPEQSYIDASLECLSQECSLRSDGLFDLYKLPLLFVCYH